MRGVWFVLLGIVLSTSVAAQSVPWRFTEVLRFSEAPPDIVFGRVADLVVDGEGRFYVLDPMNSEIYVFTPDGQHVRTMARRGAGPGELSRQTMHIALASETLAVVDLGNQRVTRFALDGRHLSDFRLSVMDGPPMGLAGLSDGSLLVRRDPLPLPPGMMRDGPMGPAAPVLLHLAPDGRVLDTIATFRHQPVVEFSASGQMSRRMPDLMPVWGLDGAGRPVVGHSDRYALQTWRDGQLGPAWGRNVARQPITRAMRERMQQTQDSVMARMPNVPNVNREMQFPDSLPVIWTVEPGPFATTLVGRATMWEDESRQESPWDVFAPDGTYLGVVALPARFRLLAARDDRIYGVVLDEDDVSYVVVYRVTR
ncbi:MAG: 6-bladed beta-propeller [Gemmatimonadales bacterium]